MHVLGEHNPGVDGKRMEPVYPPDRRPKQIDMPHQQIVAASLQQIHYEKPARPRDKGAMVVRHPCLQRCSCLKCRRDQSQLTRPIHGKQKADTPIDTQATQVGLAEGVIRRSRGCVRVRVWFIHVPMRGNRRKRLRRFHPTKLQVDPPDRVGNSCRCIERNPAQIGRGFGF